MHARRRRRNVLVAQQRLHHLQQYHMRGNPVGNGSVAARTHQSTSNQSTLTRTHNVTDNNEHGDCQMEHDESSSSSSRQQRRSHINGDVFYVSGRAHTLPSSTRPSHLLTNDTLTTFNYFTYDRDYFRERQKSSCLQDDKLRHSMQ